MLKIRGQKNKIIFLLTTLVIIFGSVYNLSGVEIERDHSEKQSQKMRRVSSPVLEKISSRVEELGPINSFQVSYRGRKIIEDYHRGISSRTPVNVKSVSKSILSGLTGIALEEGIIEELDRPAADILPELFSTVDNRQKKDITLRHLLLMRSGLRSTSAESYGRWVSSANWKKSALQQPLEEKPGTNTSYSTGDSHLLAAALQRELGGQDLLNYARRRLFQPLGEEIFGWQRSPEGIRFGGNNLSIYPPALMKIGEMYLNGGRYNGRQIIPRWWVEKSFRPLVDDTKNGFSYGYYWWVGDFGGREVKFAWGHAGQFIFIVPSEELVVAFTAERDLPGVDYTELNDRIFDFMDNKLIPLFSNRLVEK